MAEPISPTPSVSLRMSRQATVGTKPELALRKRLHLLGKRFRLHVKVPGLPRRTIDIAFPKEKVAVFVDGCFWHGCDVHRSVPRTNESWWTAKLESNRARDVETVNHLAKSGWRTLRVWEHEDTTDAGERVLALLRLAISAACADTEMGGCSGKDCS